MLCGPEDMMYAVPALLVARDHCGHCQLGPKFVCHDGPVFCYKDIQPYPGHPGVQSRYEKEDPVTPAGSLRFG